MTNNKIVEERTKYLQRQKQMILKTTKMTIAAVTVPTRCGVPNQPASTLKPVVKLTGILLFQFDPVEDILFSRARGK